MTDDIFPGRWVRNGDRRGRVLFENARFVVFAMVDGFPYPKNARFNGITVLVNRDECEMICRPQVLEPVAEGTESIFEYDACSDEASELRDAILESWRHMLWHIVQEVEAQPWLKHPMMRELRGVLKKVKNISGG